MDPLEEIRLRLESQVNEFFSPSTSNERKAQIGPLLENFSKHPGSWKQALYFLSKPESFRNAFLSMFCLTVIENSVRTRWGMGGAMSGEEKGELQASLYTFIKDVSSSPHFVRNKIIKILTDVGKFSGPAENQVFLETVLKITANDETVVIGLLFLKTISEEWSSLKDEISTERKLELKVNLIREMPKVFEILHQILATGLKHMSPSGGGDNGGGSVNPLSPGLHQIMVLALETCAHLFTWIPLDGTFAVPPDSNLRVQKRVLFSKDLIEVLCKLAGADISGTVNDDGGENISIISLNVLNEFLYRKYMPKDLDEHVNLVTSFGVDLLFKMYQGISSKTVAHKYLDKGVELLCLIANCYFFRYNKDTAKQFLMLLLNFTFAQTETIFYYECLEIWKILLDHLTAEVPFTSFSSQEEGVDLFKPMLLDLAMGIIESTIKFDVDEGNSEEFCEDEDDEDMEPPRLTKNIDVLFKIGMTLPTESLERMMSTWSYSCSYYESLQTKLDQTKTGIVLDNQITVKHFSFIVQLMGRMAEIFYNDVFENEVERGKTLVHQLLGLLMISKNFYFLRSPESMIQANCEVIYALRAWTYWLARYHSEVILADCGPSETQNFFQMLAASADVLRFVLDNNHGSIHSSVILANANLFSLTVSLIRSPHIFNLPWVQTLIASVHSLRGALQEDTFRILNKSVAALILLPWHSCATSEQEWEHRTSLYTEYMKNMMTELSNAAHTNDAPKLVLSLKMLNDQLEVVQMEGSISKKICWGVYEQVVQFLHKLAPAYIKNSNVTEEILNFFLKVMEVLRIQAGTQFFEETIRMLLGLFASANIINDLITESESSGIAVEKFLHMLEFMIVDPSPSFKKFLPDCISVALDHIYPVLAQRSSPDVKLAFFRFIREAVTYRWNYFFPGFLYAASAASGSPSSATEEDAEASRRLYKMFETIGQSFLQSDLEVFKFNLNTLAIWNKKHQIYTRMVIDLKMFDGFMAVLLQVLASKTHDLLKEEIALNLYEMASVNYPRFWQVFLPQTLEKDFPILTGDQRLFLSQRFKPKTDLHTNASPNSLIGSQSRGQDRIDQTGFTVTLIRFIEDLRYFYFCDECSKMNGGGRGGHNSRNNEVTVMNSSSGGVKS